MRSLMNSLIKSVDLCLLMIKEQPTFQELGCWLWIGIVYLQLINITITITCAITSTTITTTIGITAITTVTTVITIVNVLNSTQRYCHYKINLILKGANTFSRLFFSEKYLSSNNYHGQHRNIHSLCI